MTANVGNLDRTIRFVVGAALIVLTFVFNIYWLLIPAAIAIATGFMRFCPLWLVMRINTVRKNMGV